MADEEKTKRPRWCYDPGESPKRKHGWAEDVAGFRKQGKVLVGKCPKGLKQETAEELINAGIAEVNLRQESEHPKRIYVIHDGVLYRAVSTEPGKSYHGFPELPRIFDELDDELKSAIWERAKQTGQEKEFKKWLRQNQKL